MIPERLRREVIERAQNQCEYCRSQAAFCPDPFSIEHVIPRSQQGESDSGNLALACQGCNNAKYTSTTGIDPLTNLLQPLFHPRQDRWIDHFVWSADGLEIIGVTPTGRATVERLRLNRDSVVGWRRLAQAFGIHPPLP